MWQNPLKSARHTDVGLLYSAACTHIHLYVVFACDVQVGQTGLRKEAGRSVTGRPARGSQAHLYAVPQIPQGPVLWRHCWKEMVNVRQHANADSVFRAFRPCWPWKKAFWLHCGFWLPGAVKAGWWAASSAVTSWPGSSGWAWLKTGVRRCATEPGYNRAESSNT